MRPHEHYGNRSCFSSVALFTIESVTTLFVNWLGFFSSAKLHKEVNSKQVKHHFWLNFPFK